MSDQSNRAAAEAPEAGARRRRSRFGSFELKLGLLIGIAGLFGSRLGQLWVAFDVFSQFTLQFAVLTVAFLVGNFLPRGRLTAAFVLTVGGIAAIGAWPHAMERVPAAISQLKEGETAIKLASFNLWYGNPDIAAIAAEVRRLDADVVTLIEVGPDKRAMVEGLKDLYPHQTECFADAYCHLAILSKFPIGETVAKSSWEGPPLMLVRLGGKARDLAVMGVHTIRFPHSRAQFRQVRALARFIETMPGRMVVMGDFNATPFSRVTKTVETETGLVRLTSLPTWPAWIELPQVAIDHIFASPDMRVIEDERVGRPTGSDHYPIVMTLALPAP
ncbi:MAG: hypothetical protein FJX63_09855 [Alphaproteobacteria bacterium]|nr:hypothetical protein [Alphaproteobacteria bacterium]